MVQVGKPTFLGATFDAPGLDVAVRVFDASGPVTAWMAATNYDGNTYRAPYTFTDVGAFSFKTVVFTDNTFATRDPDHPEADANVQVEDVAALVLDVPISAHDAIGTVGGAISTGGASNTGGGAGVIGVVQSNGRVVGVVPVRAIIGIVNSE